MLVPGAGIEPLPPTVEAQRLNHSTAREIPKLVFHVADFPVTDRRRAPTPRGDVFVLPSLSRVCLRGPTDPRPPGPPSFLSRGACMNEEESFAVRRFCRLRLASPRLRLASHVCVLRRHVCVLCNRTCRWTPAHQEQEDVRGAGSVRQAFGGHPG